MQSSIGCHLLPDISCWSTSVDQKYRSAPILIHSFLKQYNKVVKTSRMVNAVKQNRSQDIVIDFVYV